MMSRVNQLEFVFFVLLLSIGMSGCGSQAASPTPIVTVVSPPTHAPTSSATLWIPPTRPPTGTPSPAATGTRSAPPTSTSMPDSTATFAPTSTSIPCQFDPRTPISPLDPIRDMLLFVVPMGQSPMVRRGWILDDLTPEEDVERGLAVWACSVDGKRIGQLLKDPSGAGIYVSPDEPYNWLLASNTQLDLQSDLVYQAPLPSECEQDCDTFGFSADGRWLAFLWGPSACGRGVGVMNVNTGQVISRDDEMLAAGSDWIRFISDDKLLLSIGHCEGGEFYLLDLTSGDKQLLGTAGLLSWNSNKSAFVVEASQYLGWQSSVWGYNSVSGQFFLSEDWERHSNPLWTPDGAQVIYQHRLITASQASTYTVGPSQIRIVDTNGAEHVLLDDPQYDHYLCTDQDECAWSGDWLQIRQIAYLTHTLPSPEDADWSKASITCALYGRKCAGQARDWGLNWRTGELIPWEQVLPPTATPTPTVAPPTTVPVTPAPALDLTPIYRHPGGEFALYPGRDNYSLWCVPQAGEPVRWIINGEHFVYVP